MEVYCDGSSLGNGRKDAAGGIGIFFGDGHAWNHSEGFVGTADTKVTNQTMELTAILRTLLILARHGVRGGVSVLTDSMYSINCLTAWVDKWKSNGWKTAAGKPVLNRELIQDILAAMEAHEGDVEFVHVRSHTAAPPRDASPAYARWYGNHMADRLATEAAAAARKSAAAAAH
jgi:ribonuclease HI